MRRSTGSRSRRPFASLFTLAALLLATGGRSLRAVEGGALFVDRAAETGLDFVHFNGMSGELYFAEMTGAGGAFFDYDGDGDLDVYLLQGHMLGRDKSLADAIFQPRHPLPLTDRLYRNDLGVGADGEVVVRFTDVTEASGLRAPGYGMGVAAGDYDNDGWVDLYVTNFGSNQMLRNNGDGTFTDVTEETGTDDPRWSVSAAFLDFDRDGWLDLYVGNYVDFRLATHKPCSSPTGTFDYCGPLAYRPEPDRLFRNRGDGTFEDVASRSAMDGERRAGLGVATGDFNGDGWIDFYVANDQMPNQLWLNQEGANFRNEAILAGCAVSGEGQPQASMGVVSGDLNGDGSEDLFMSHLTRETNTLYLNDGGGFFQDATRPTGIGLPSFKFNGFGVGLFDYDNDGWLDLFVANGEVKRIEKLLRANDPYPLHQINQLFHNLGGGQFEEVTAQAGEVFALSEVTRGTAAGDVDLDGDTDLLVTNNAGPVRLLLNQVGARGHWLGLSLSGREVPRAMLGTRVTVVPAEGPPRVRRVRTDGSYASANDPRVLVGLGGSGSVEKVRAEWPDGRIQEWWWLPADRYHALR